MFFNYYTTLVRFLDKCVRRSVEALFGNDKQYMSHKVLHSVHDFMPRLSVRQSDSREHDVSGCMEGICCYCPPKLEDELIRICW